MFLMTIQCTARTDYEVHQHLYHLFDDGARMFLWRWAGVGSVHVLSIVPPVQTIKARRIDVDAFPSGTPLSFETRIVAARCKQHAGRRHGAKVPLLRHEERRQWLAGKLQAAGAELCFARCEDARIVAGDGLVIIGADITGMLVIHDRARFAAHLQAGFGRNRAFGAGLIWIPEVMT